MYRAAIFAACVAVASAFAPTLPATGRTQGANAVSGELNFCSCIVCSRVVLGPFTFAFAIIDFLCSGHPLLRVSEVI
jgi:hypothetical protein